MFNTRLGPRLFVGPRGFYRIRAGDPDAYTLSNGAACEYARIVERRGDVLTERSCSIAADAAARVTTEIVVEPDRVTRHIWTKYASGTSRRDRQELDALGFNRTTEWEFASGGAARAEYAEGERLLTRIDANGYVSSLRTRTEWAAAGGSGAGKIPEGWKEGEI